MNITTKVAEISDFTGDVLIIPCDTELTYEKFGMVKTIFSLGGNDLITELSVIGYCQIGSAVITKGYKLKSQWVIFMPITDHQTKEQISYIDLHKSLRACLTLATLYQAKTIAMAEIQISHTKTNLLESVTHKLYDSTSPNPPKTDEIEDIIISTAKSFSTTIKDLTIYKSRP